MKIDSYIQVQRLPGSKYAAKVKPGRRAKPLYTHEYTSYKEALNAARALVLSTIPTCNLSKVRLFT